MNDVNIDENIILRAKSFTEKYIKPIAKEIDECSTFPDKLKNLMAEEGFFGIQYPKSYGGLELSSETAFGVITELAKGSAGIALTLIVHWMAVDTLIKYGTDYQRNTYLLDLIQGKKIAAYSVSEFQAGSDVASISSTARKADNSYIINGAKYFCTNGDIADIYLIICKTNPDLGVKGISMFLIKKGTTGFIIGPKGEKMGCRSSVTTNLVMKNCIIPMANLVGEENEGFKIAMNGLTCGRLGMAAMGIGIADACIEEACQHANKRIAFGKQINKLFSVQEMISDTYVKLQASKLLLKQTCVVRDEGKNYSFESSVVKLQVSEAVNTACHNAVQILGGHGYMKDNNVERYARDGRLMDIGVGASEVLKMVVGTTILSNYK